MVNNSKRSIIVYAHWKGIKSPLKMGTLYSERLKGKEIFSFEYDRYWLKEGPSQLLDPNLQLYSGLHYNDDDQGNFGIFFFRLIARQMGTYIDEETRSSIGEEGK